MSRSDIERAYWNGEARQGNVDALVCDSNVTPEESINTILSLASLPGVALGTPTRILELGCGVGRIMIPMAQLLPEAEITGVDISANMIRIARERAAETGKQLNLHFYVSDNRDIYYPGVPDYPYFDLVYSMAVFQHMDDEGVEEAIHRSSDLLEDNGILCFQYIEGDENEPFSKHRPRKTMQRWLDDSKFEVLSYNKALIYNEWTWVVARRKARND